MKELQYRQKKLLEYLIELNDFKPVRYFSERLSCSDKTIRNDLKYFEEQSIKIEKISGKGIRLSNKNKILINDLLDEQPRKLELTTEQRRMKILYDLLDGTKLSIQSLSDNYFVSKTSIVNDFKVIEEKLSVYGLKLKKDVSGTKLIGEETNIRKALVDILNQMINYNNNSIKKVYSRIDNATLEELEEHFGNKNIEKIEKIIGNAEAFLNYKITDPYYINLVTHILILINRIKRDKTIYSKLDLQNKFYNEAFYQASVKMAKDIENTFNVELNNAEIFYLYRYLASSGGLKEKKNIDSIEDEYVKQIADEIITTCLNIFPIEFHFNDELYRALLLHLRPMLNRVKYKIFIKNPILDEVKLELSELMILLKLVMSKIEIKYNLSKISEVDIQENDDDDIFSYDKTKMMLTKHKEINAIFIVAAGVYGACRAVLSLEKQNDLTIIAFDTVPTTVEMMKKNVIKAVIYQHPYRQGQRAMQIVFEYLVNGISLIKVDI